MQLVLTPGKARILIVGTGGVGTIAAYALETGGKAHVTAVLRSNYDVILREGINIDSVEHGRDIQGWRPSEMLKETVRNSIPDISKEGIEPYEFILVTSKNTPDVPGPSLPDLLRPAITPEKTALVLCQNGLNIEQPLLQSFPSTPMLSSVSQFGVSQRGPGSVFQSDPDVQASGVDFRESREGLLYKAIFNDERDSFWVPSMLQDVLGERVIEVEVILGEPLRVGLDNGVDMAVTKTVYGLLRGVQVGILEKKGLWEVSFDEENPYL